MRHRALVLAACTSLAPLLAASCGGGSSTTAPSSSSTSTTTTPTSTATVPTTYLGALSVAGGSDLGGTLQLKASQGLLAEAHIERALPSLAQVGAWLVPALQAQSGVSATGTLVTTGGSVVPLTGTYSTGTFNVSGGGYTISATVSGGNIAGTGTAPGGLSAVVSAPTPAAAPTPAPADPSGTYRGSVRIDAVEIFRNTFASGAVNTNCTFNLAITGNLTIEVQNVGNGQVGAHLTSTWQEAETSRSCAFAFTPPGTLAARALDFQGSATNIQMGATESGAAGQGTLVRTQGFSGAIGTGQIVGTISRSFNFTTPTSNPGEVHVEAYPTSSATVTLTRQ